MTTVMLSIAGKGEDDAPLLDDLLDQIKDFFAIVEGVGATIAAGDDAPFSWRVIGLSKNSPATITAEAVAKSGHSNGDLIASMAYIQSIEGLTALQHVSEKPRGFSDSSLEAAERFAKRAAFSLADTVISGDNSPPISVKSQIAASIASHIQQITIPERLHPFRELGSFEGYIDSIGVDGFGRPYIVVKNRISNSDVKCFLSGSALEMLQQEPVAKVVWRKRRIIAAGLLKYRDLTRLTQAEIDKIDFVGDGPWPSYKSVQDRNYTNGLDSTTFIERLRDGQA